MSLLLATFEAFFSLSTICHVVLGFGSLIAMFSAWSASLDRAEHDPGQAQASMLGILLLVTLADIGLAASGFVHVWVLYLSLFANCWGGLDAVLRFPAKHRGTSLFMLKQYALLGLKTYGYTVGVANIWDNMGNIFLVLLLGVWSPPLLYLMARPLEPSEQVAADEADNIDLAMRVLKLARFGEERQRCFTRCHGWWRKRLIMAAGSAEPTLVDYALRATDSSALHRKKLSGRTI